MKKKQSPNNDAGKDKNAAERIATRKNCQTEAYKDNHSGLRKNLYLDMIKTLYERYRGRVSTYYCPEITCKKTFWSAKEGYVCPECGSFGVISEYHAETADENNPRRSVIGYLDNIGRLVCGECMQNYNTDDDIGLIVYSDTQPYSHESCDICKHGLSRD